MIPNAAATRRSAGPRTRGRQIASSTAAANGEPQERGARRPELVEQRDGERGPELQRGDGGDDERDAARLVAHPRPVTTVRL